MASFQETTMPQLNQAIRDRMDDGGKTITDLKNAVGISYEHARKIYNGQSPASRMVLKEICKWLKLDHREIEKLYVSAKIEQEYGGIPLEISGKNPELAPIERAWPKLTDQQKKDATTMITSWAKHKNDKIQ